MPSTSQLETVLRYAHLHELTAEQWLKPTRECLQAGEQEADLCALLLSSLFSFTRVSDPLIESYLTIATTTDTITVASLMNQLLPCVESTTSQHWHQWSFLLKLLPQLIYTFDSDAVIADLQSTPSEERWVQILKNALIILSHVVAVGLYPDYYSTQLSQPSPALTTGLSFSQQVDSQFSFQSQHSIDVDATLDIDNTQRIEEEDKPAPSIPLENIAEDRVKKAQASRSLAMDNATVAAHIMIHLIEKKNAKRVFEVRNNLKRQSGMQVEEEEEEEPWVQCQAKLDPSNHAIKQTMSHIASQHPDIQNVKQLVQRLTDRELERRMTVHMKYHELEDEGTARAMPSAGLMGLLYHLVQIRPSLSDEQTIHYLVKLQTIKGSFDESFYLELWLTALTGLREASLNTSCQSVDVNEKQEKSCLSIVATNRLLWKSLVLVKLPSLIQKMEQQKPNTKLLQENEFNSIESSLQQLKAFTGLINACSPPACCSEFYAPDSMSSDLVDKIAFGKAGEDDEDDIMKMINDINCTSDLNTVSLMKSIRTISSHDIFTNIVSICERYGFVRPHVAIQLLDKKKASDDMMDIMDDDIEKTNPAELIDQNIDARIEALQNNLSLSSLTEFIHIGLVSPIHLKKILNFLIQLIQQRSAENDFFSLSKLCAALIESRCIIDLMLQLYSPQVLLGPLESICNHWSPCSFDVDMDTEDNDTNLHGVQSLYYKFGKIWQLVTLTVKKFKLHKVQHIFQEKEGYLCKYIYSKNLDNMESLMDQWLIAMVNEDELSDDLLRSTLPQQLVFMTPTLIHRAILFCHGRQLSQEALNKMISRFFQPYFEYLSPSAIETLSDELLDRPHTIITLDCLSHMISMPLPRQVLLHPILGSIESLIEMNKQTHDLLTPESMQRLVELQESVLSKVDDITSHVETITTGITPWTLFEKATRMFKSIVKSGRSMYMSDVDADTHALWDAPVSMQSVSHYLDMVLFETALEMGGAHWFVGMIVDQVLEAGKCGGAVRAAELGSCLIATPLLSFSHHNSCLHLLRCLLQDALPSMLNICAQQDMSYFQGQTLGVFTSDCLVLMHDQDVSVQALGRWFFEALVIDVDQATKKSKLEHDHDGTQFAEWNQTTIKSAVWKGFIKGLMSNPMIEEVWPNAFAS
ncbi:hypothetical protein EDC96DRAFT_85724 [Choanephora cucurbitarum]|nr:hypothetical protein EDC96DRAFT_85724 [Choanephora cucurbitarum]